MTSPLTSDSLNPMLVRDLRQGLRSSRFTLVFLLLQICMAFFVTLGLTSGQGSEIGQSLTLSLMVALVLFYILGLPMAGTFAFTPEFSENRIDLLKLTQMSARSLVWGKWLSLMLQGMMVFLSLLPYLILTYFFGRVDLAKELLELCVLFGLSALLVGCCVVLSCFRSVVFQILIILFLLWVTGQCLDTVTELQHNGYAFGLRTVGPMHVLAYCWYNPGIAIWLYLSLVLPALWLVMEYGATRLAPISENHDTPQRIVLLAILAVTGLAMVLDMIFPGTYLDDFTDLYFTFGTWVCAIVLVFAASAEPSPYPDSYRPFVRFGLSGKFVGRALLYPGWPSALPFTMLVTAFYLLLATSWYSLRQEPFPDNWLTCYLLVTPAVLFPQLAGWLVLGRTRMRPLTRYFLVAVFCICFYVVCAAFYEVTERQGFVVAAGVLPSDAWLLLASGQLNSAVMDPSVLFTLRMLAATVGGFTVSFMCLRSISYSEQTRYLEKRAAASPGRPPCAPGA